MSKEAVMAVIDNVRHELNDRLHQAGVGKRHLSVRYEPNARIVRVGACIAQYDWDNRNRVLDALLAFEESHADEFDLEFDIVPLEPVIDPTYAEI